MDGDYCRYIRNIGYQPRMSHRDHATSPVELASWRKVEGWRFGAVGRVGEMNREMKCPLNKDEKNI